MIESLAFGILVALAYVVGEYTGRKKREREIHAKINENTLKELQQDHVL